jgi:hypothetical protein
MKYYDLIQQYVKTGSAIPVNQFNIIKGNKNLLKDYFRTRNNLVKKRKTSLVSYELGFINENLNYMSMFNKETLIWHFRLNILSGEAYNIFAKNIINLYGSEFNDNDIRDIIERSYNADVIGMLYKIMPEYFSSVYWKLKLIRLGVLDSSILDTVIEVKIPLNKMVNFVYADNYVISDILTYNAKNYCTGFMNRQSNWRVFANMLDYYVNSDNILKIRKLFSKRYYKMGVDDVARNALASVFYDEKMKDVKDAILYSHGNSTPENCPKMAYKALYDALSTYGEVKSLNENGAVVIVDVSKLDIVDAGSYCNSSDLECFFKSSIGNTIASPGIGSAKIDENKFNELLSDKLDELLNKP